MANSKSPGSVRPDVINKHVASVYPALAMLAGMQLDVFTPLAGGPKSAPEIADALDVASDRLEPLLYALVSGGLLVLQDGRFANTPEADKFLVRGGARFMGDTHKIYSDLWASTMKTAASIRAGAPQAMHDFHAMGADELYTFLQGQDAGSGAVGRKLLNDYDVSNCRRHLDLGGGAGGIALTLAKALPELQSTIVELPKVAEVTRRFVAEADMTARVNVVGMDAVRECPPTTEGFDLVTLRSLLQVLSRADAESVLHHAGKVTVSGGRLFIMGRILDDSRLSPPETVAANVQFLNIYADGGAYTEAEHRQWLGNAGFNNIVRNPMAGGYSLIHAEKT